MFIDVQLAIEHILVEAGASKLFTSVHIIVNTIVYDGSLAWLKFGKFGEFVYFAELKFIQNLILPYTYLLIF